MTKHYISVDGGGTKISAVLFNDRWELVGTGMGGPINSNFFAMDQVKANMESCVDQCLAGKEDLKIDKVYLSMPNAVKVCIDLLEARTEVGESFHYSEGRMSLLAGSGQPTGFVALSGTGSVGFAIDEEGGQHVGAWGSLIGDEGSGYEVGKAGIQAAIHYLEERGPQTMILDMILEKWKVNHLRKIVPPIIQSDFPASTIASVARLVSEAALSGDAVAQGIYEKAGKSIAVQMSTLLRKKAKSGDVVVVSGGVWKGCGQMFETFRKHIQSSFPDVNVQLPLFEPVMGGVVAEFLLSNQTSEDWQKIQSHFHTFRYRTKWRDTF